MAFDEAFYTPDLAVIHHEGFGDIAGAAAALLLSLLADVGHEDGTIVDLACGTGILPRIVSDAGYEVVAFDYSQGMLDIAGDHAPRARLERRSIYDDAELPPAVGCVANGEALNYAADPRAGLPGLSAVARRVRAAIEPRGIFLFDVSTPGRAGPTRTAERFREGADWAISAHAAESEDGTRLDRSMTFTRGDCAPVDEHHVLHLYEPAAVVDVLEHAGFGVEVRTSYSDEPTASTPTGGWIVVVARPARSGGLPPPLVASA